MLVWNLDGAITLVFFVSVISLFSIKKGFRIYSIVFMLFYGSILFYPDMWTFLLAPFLMFMVYLDQKKWWIMMPFIIPIGAIAYYLITHYYYWHIYNPAMFYSSLIVAAILIRCGNRILPIMLMAFAIAWHYYKMPICALVFCGYLLSQIIRNFRGSIIHNILLKISRISIITTQIKILFRAGLEYNRS